MSKKIVYVLLGLILFVGLVLRNHNLTTWPREGATFDEFAWTFQGLSIWEKGIPTSWSPHGAYVNKVEYYNPQGAHFTLVTPYLEHPPLFGLVAGGFAYLNGVRTFDDVTIAKIRPIALLMGGLSIFAVFLLASAVYGSAVGLVASGFYAIIPTVVIGSRLVQNENFFIPFFLFTLYFAYTYLKTSSIRHLVPAILIAALLPLAKMRWIAAPISIIGMFLFSKKWKASLWVAVATAGAFSVWLIYGFSSDPSLFANLWKLQLARYAMSFDSLFIVFRDPITADRLLVDGWIYFGWLGIVWLLTGNVKKNLPIVFGFLAYFAVFVFAIPSESMHGWYRYPFYPFFAISIAVYLREFFNKNYIATVVFFVITGLSMFAGSWEKTLGFSYPVFRTYLAFIAVGALPGIFPRLQEKRIFRWINAGVLLGIIILSMWTVIEYNEQ